MRCLLMASESVLISAAVRGYGVGACDRSKGRPEMGKIVKRRTQPPSYPRLVLGLGSGLEPALHISPEARLPRGSLSWASNGTKIKYPQVTMTWAFCVITCCKPFKDGPFPNSLNR